MDKEYLNEIWKDINGYEGLYQVSNFGQVKSVSRIDFNGHKIKQRILKCALNKGYLSVVLFKNGIPTNFKIHRLVAKAFLPNPYNLPCVNHKDENKTNNIVLINEDGSIDYEKSNLEWCTHKYNSNYGTRNIKISLNTKGKHFNRRDLSKPILQYDKTGQLLKEWPSASEIQRAIGVNSSAICKCCRNVSSYLSAGGYIWRFVS